MFKIKLIQYRSDSPNTSSYSPIKLDEDLDLTPNALEISSSPISPVTFHNGNEQNEQTENSINLNDIISIENEEVVRAPSKCKRTIYMTLTIAAVILNPFLSYFLFMVIRNASDYMRKELGLENTFWEEFIIVLGAILSFMNALCDFTVVNPIEEAKKMDLTSKNNQLMAQTDPISPYKRIPVKFITYFNQLIANSTYIIGATSGALSISYLTRLSALQWSLGIPIAILNIVYYNMLTKTKIDEHTHRFVNRLVNLKKTTLINAIKSPARSFEVTVQVLINSLNRGIIFGYVMDQILTNLFDEKNDRKSNYINYLVLYSVGATFYTSLFSRTLNAHKQFFNSQFDKLSENLLKNTKISRSKIFIDSIMILLRAVSASVLLYRNGFSNFSLNVASTGSLFLFLMTQGIYVRYKIRLYQAALSIKRESIIELQPIDEQELNQQTDENMSSEKVFDLIKEQFKTNGLKIGVTILNAGGRAARWISCIGFLAILNEVVKTNSNLKLDFYDLLCIQQLLCNLSLENDATFFQDSMVDTLAYYKTKLHLEKNERHFGWESLVKAKADYPKSYLKKFLPIQERDIELPRVLPYHSSIPEMQPIENGVAMEEESEQKSPVLNSDEKKDSVKPLTTQFELQKIRAKENTKIKLEVINSNNSLSPIGPTAKAECGFK